ncbi:G-type lectin S-receptor-like serine/threonine-protein kinase At2g19130 [Durio zibethinus]|uniref:non-specific serine/threonine protein kinase n=1 Tax=Durio zibethinus TaxID=66656 RepID=A0A6P5WPA4_DURZI|nr:G-type lectin S-receptor-like serine/threonine-protein kinase At2g19130 [Durio zibethinus]
MRGWFAPPVSLLVILFLALQFTNGNDTIHRGETITHPKTIISSNGTFELGFFSATSYSKYYLGIWHKVSKPARVWVANREYPSLSDSSNLTINSEGNLVISDGRMSYKVTDITTSNNSNTFARLLDSGNLVLLDGISSAVLWQSFDFPTDTILSGMNLGQAKFFPKNWSLVSWRSQEDPAVGSFSLDVNIEGELVIKEGSKTYWTGSPFLFENYSVDVLLHQVQNRAMRKSHPGDNYITWHFLDPSTIMHIALDMFGKLKLQSWSEDDQSWPV